jgi:hypothetical protein
LTSFDLFLFSTDPATVVRHAAAGVDGFIVDWERIGKDARQAGADTEINPDTAEDLRRVRAATRARVLCRLNAFGPWTPSEMEDAVSGGADEVLLPMVRDPSEVAQAIGLAQGRCGVGILIETVDAVRAARDLARLPLGRVYVGLNDLAIERKSRSIFEPLVDGVVDGIRPFFEVPFGLAGLTVPEGGEPIPCRLLVGAMARLGCSFSFLRRSWRRDTAGRDPTPAVARVRAALSSARRRDGGEVARDQADLAAAIRAVSARSLAS